MAGPKRAPKKKRSLLLGEKQRWVSGCVVFVTLFLMTIVAALLYAWLFGRA